MNDQVYFTCALITKASCVCPLELRGHILDATSSRFERTPKYRYKSSSEWIVTRAPSSNRVSVWNKLWDLSKKPRPKMVFTFLVIGSFVRLLRRRCRCRRRRRRLQSRLWRRRRAEHRRRRDETDLGDGDRQVGQVRHRVGQRRVWVRRHPLDRVDGKWVDYLNTCR